MSDPVTLPNGEVEQFTLKVEGKPFRCDCGCNVFHKPNAARPSIYRCNACDATFDSE